MLVPGQEVAALGDVDADEVDGREGHAGITLERNMNPCNFQRKFS